jgi:Protein of unknown function (DUF2281)
MYEQQIAERARELPLDKQQEVLDFVEFLRVRNGTATVRRSAAGALEHLGLDFSEEDLEELRREMWGNFPRDLEA